MKRKQTMMERVNEGLTVGKLAAALVGIGALFAFVWGFDARYETRSDAETTSSWLRYGIRNNRLEYLNDRTAECDQKKLTKTMSDNDAVLCARYELQAGTVGKEVADLKSTAQGARKEKP